MAKKLSKKEEFKASMRKDLGGHTFTSSKYGEVAHWIDTGDYGLNRIISGDMYKGIPSGRVIVFGGESQSGKSLISADIAANALNKNNYDVVYYFDGEGGAMKDFFKNRGCNLDDIDHILVKTVEHALIKINKAFTKIEEFQKEVPDFKALFILDSLGSLITNKVFTDLEKNKVASDMGLRAKVCNLMVKATTIPALITNVPFIIINHVYADPSALHATKIKQQSGGGGVQYMARLVIQCSKNFGIEDKDKKTGREKYFNYTTLKFITTKNSFAQPTYESEMVLNFKTGSIKLYSIFKPAINYGFIKKGGGWYTIPSHEDPEKKFRKKEILTNEKLWESFMDDFNKKSIDDLSYGGKEIIDDELAYFEDELDDDDGELNDVEV